MIPSVNNNGSVRYYLAIFHCAAIIHPYKGIEFISVFIFREDKIKGNY